MQKPFSVNIAYLGLIAGELLKFFSFSYFIFIAPIAFIVSVRDFI